MALMPRVLLDVALGHHQVSVPELGLDGQEIGLHIAQSMSMAAP
jgi:hypothetical protein